MPKVSVLLATYNHAKYIKQTIESVLRQSFQDFEIIVAVDGSTDNTLEVLNTIKDSRIKTIVLPYNQGISAASNAGLSLCTGEYIAILDSDDLFREDKLARQAEFLDGHPEYGSVVTQASLIDENGEIYVNENHPYYTLFKKKNRSQAEWLKRFFFVGNCICHPSVMTRRYVFEKAGNYNNAMQQVPDFDMVIRLVAQAPLYMIEEEMVFVRVRRNMENNSAYSIEKDVRNQFEHIDLLDIFTKLPASIAKNVFCDYVGDVPLTDEMVPFIVSKAALVTPISATKYFGLRVIAEMLKNESLKQLLFEKYGFNTKKFYEILGTIPVFSAQHVDVQRLYIAYENNFYEQYSLQKPVCVYRGIPYYENKSHFIIPDELCTNYFRWDPTEGQVCRVSIKSIRAKDREGNWHHIKSNKLASNAAEIIEDNFIFLTIDPMIIIKTDFDVAELIIDAGIEFSWNYLLENFKSLLTRELKDHYLLNAAAKKQNLIPKDVSSGHDIFEVSFGQSHNFESSVFVQEDEWSFLSFDYRVFEDNYAVSVFDLSVECADCNGKELKPQIHILAECQKDGSYTFFKNSGIWVLTPQNTEKIYIKGTLRKFSNWNKNVPLMASLSENNPLKNLPVDYSDGEKEGKIHTNAFVHGSSVELAFLIPSEADTYTFIPTHFSNFAIRMNEAYALQKNRKKVPVEPDFPKKWVLRQDVQPVSISMKSNKIQKDSLLIVKYELVIGQTREIVKVLFHKNITASLRFALYQMRHK